MNASPTQAPPVSDPLDELQRAAVRVALEGSSLKRYRFVFRSLRRLLSDTGDTGQVLAMAIALNGPHFSRVWLEMASHDEGARVLRERPNLDGKGVDRTQLRALPDGTLGREYLRFIEDNGLDGDFFQAPPGLPEDVGYLSKRLRQSHDVWHAVTGYGPSVRDELALQAFTWAQLGVPHAKLVAVFGFLRFTWRDPGLLAHIVQGYRRGKKAQPLAPAYWESRWERALSEVQAEFGVEPS